MTMYLARFLSEESEAQKSEWVQGLVQLSGAQLSRSGNQEEWKSTLNQLISGLGQVPQCMVSLRVIAKDGSLFRALLCLAPAEFEPQLRRSLATFSRLDSIIQDSVTFVSNRQEYDTQVLSLPSYRYRVTMPSYGVEGAWFACDFRLSLLLEKLISSADTHGYELGYQINTRDYAVPSELLRAVRLNLLSLKSLPGLSDSTYLFQQRLTENLVNASGLVEEFLMVSTLDAAGLVGDILERQFFATYGQYKFDSPSFEFVQNGHEDSITMGIHSSVFTEPAIDEICSSTVESQERIGLLTWCPSGQLGGRFRGLVPRTYPLEDEADRKIDSSLELPSSYEGNEDYIFISYRRTDIHRVAPIIKHIARQGFHIWYDRGIPGGAEWDELIENKILNCRLLLLFVSSAAIQSKYVRREAKFADAINKHVLSVLLEPTDLDKGMKMMLTQYQILDAIRESFEQDLVRALNYLEKLRSNDSLSTL